MLGDTYENDTFDGGDCDDFVELRSCYQLSLVATAGTTHATRFTATTTATANSGSGGIDSQKLQDSTSLNDANQH